MADQTWMKFYTSEHHKQVFVVKPDGYVMELVWADDSAELISPFQHLDDHYQSSNIPGFISDALQALQALPRPTNDTPSTSIETRHSTDAALVSAVPVRQISLGGLPAELRILIYSYIFEDHDFVRPRLVHRSVSETLRPRLYQLHAPQIYTDEKNSLHPEDLAITRVSRQIRIEALSVFYSVTTFDFGSLPATMFAFLQTLDTFGRLDMIRRVRMSTFGRSFSAKDLCRALAKLAKARVGDDIWREGKLETLKIRATPQQMARPPAVIPVSMTWMNGAAQTIPANDSITIDIKQSLADVLQRSSRVTLNFVDALNMAAEPSSHEDYIFEWRYEDQNNPVKSMHDAGSPCCSLWRECCFSKYTEGPDHIHNAETGHSHGDFSSQIGQELLLASNIAADSLPEYFDHNADDMSQQTEPTEPDRTSSHDHPFYLDEPQTWKSLAFNAEKVMFTSDRYTNSWEQHYTPGLTAHLPAEELRLAVNFTHATRHFIQNLYKEWAPHSDPTLATDIKLFGAQEGHVEFGVDPDSDDDMNALCEEDLFIYHFQPQKKYQCTSGCAEASML